MRDKIRAFFYGRYGSDPFNRFLSACALGLLLLSIILNACKAAALSSLIYLLALGTLGYSCFRSLSKNIYKRQEENGKYLLQKTKLAGKAGLLKQRWKDRKTYKYFRCPACKASLRVPKGKGKIRITCRKCGHVFEEKT
jgi:rubredoxin